MELPAVLQRMLASALQHDELQNWSVYEERDGKYTFKLRFNSKKVSHISSVDSIDNIPIHSESFKRKSAKQKSRDNKRSENFQRLTRSQSRKTGELPEKPRKAVDLDNNMVDGLITLADIPIFEPKRSPENEMVGHSPFLRPDAPEFLSRALSLDSSLVPDEQVSETADVNILEDTLREEFNISKAEVPSLSDEECDAIDDKFRCPGNCHPSCGFGSDEMDGNHKVFKCIKCSSMPGGHLYVCQSCIDGGAHAPHRKYLQLLDL